MMELIKQYFHCTEEDDEGDSEEEDSEEESEEEEDEEEDSSSDEDALENLRKRYLKVECQVYIFYINYVAA